jgi:ribonuclease VapC
MFVDASAIVAILTEESDGPQFSDRIQGADGLFTSPVAVFEAVSSVARKDRLPVPFVAKEVQMFLNRAQIETRAISQDVGHTALAAFAKYGKGSGHPARLNLGDCFAYAMAKQHGVPLLYKGNDFSQTDIA